MLVLRQTIYRHTSCMSKQKQKPCHNSPDLKNHNITDILWRREYPNTGRSELPDLFEYDI